MGLTPSRSLRCHNCSDSCTEYYGTGFDDCLKQVVSAFSELDLFDISMDAPEPVTPTRNIVIDNDDGTYKSQLPPKADGDVVLAQPAVNPPPTPISKISVVIVNANDPQPQRDGGTLADASNA